MIEERSRVNKHRPRGTGPVLVEWRSAVDKKGWRVWRSYRDLDTASRAAQAMNRGYPSDSEPHYRVRAAIAEGKS